MIIVTGLVFEIPIQETLGNWVEQEVWASDQMQTPALPCLASQEIDQRDLSDAIWGEYATLLFLNF